MAGNGFATVSSLGRMFVCGGTGPGLKYLDSAEVLDDHSGETVLKECDTKKREKVVALHCTGRRMGDSKGASEDVEFTSGRTHSQSTTENGFQQPQKIDG